MIPLMNLKAGFADYYDEAMLKITSLIDSTQFIGGKEVELFEKEFAEDCGVTYAVGCANGTSAIEIALRALSIGYGDQVIVPANSFIATAEAVSNVGAEVVFVDVEEGFYTIDPLLVEQILVKDISKKVKAVIPVHLYGQMADMPKLMDIAGRFDVKVIEDSAQAHQSELMGKRPAQLGDVATFSFFPGKNLGAFGDAGALVTNDQEIYERCKAYVNHGRSKAEKYIHSSIGANHRIDTLQAAVLRIKLRHLGKWSSMRKQKAGTYTKLLANVDVVVPKIRVGADPVWHLYVIKVENRDALQEFLKRKGITTSIHYPVPLHKQPAYAKLNVETHATAESNAKQVLSLPFWPEISEDEISTVVSAIREFYSQEN